MLIDHVFPEYVADRGTLKDLLVASMRVHGLPQAVIDSQLASVPPPLVDAKTFLDRMTGLWRYEFGEPYELNGELMFGVHMWLPVEHLRIALNAASSRVPAAKQPPYFARLADRGAHWTTLSEMMPGARLNARATADFEVPGLGAGNRTVDWEIEFAGRRIILDVKSRFTDLLKQAQRKDDKGFMPEPDHDPTLLFRSVEGKFLDADPDTALQGAWITTHIKQNRALLEKAFSSLPADKVHFAIFGDWEADVHILARREEDRTFLLEAFTATESSRFTYER